MHNLTTGAFSLVHHELDQPIPSTVCNTFGKVMIFDHLLYVQILEGYESIFIDQLSRCFVSIIASSEIEPMVCKKNCCSRGAL